MMTKLLLTTHWTVDEAETILAFLDELREVILTGYEIELNETRQLETEGHANTDEPSGEQSCKITF